MRRMAQLMVAAALVPTALVLTAPPGSAQADDCRSGRACVYGGDNYRGDRTDFGRDTFEGAAWLGITPFLLQGFRLRGMPPLPRLSTFAELNVRTYVTHGDKPGIWFFTQVLQGTSELFSPFVGSGIAWWAHVGGFVSGWALLHWLEHSARPAVRYNGGPWER